MGKGGRGRRERAASRSPEELEREYGGMGPEERRRAMNADRNARYRARVAADRRRGGEAGGLPVGAMNSEHPGVEVDGSKMRERGKVMARSSREMQQWREEKARLDAERERDREDDAGAAERTLGLGGGLKARYGGYCELCEEKILEEETIVARKIETGNGRERKWVHEECAEDPEMGTFGVGEKSILRQRKKAREKAESEARVCGECFMVKAANGTCNCIG